MVFSLQTVDVQQHSLLLFSRNPCSDAVMSLMSYLSPAFGFLSFTLAKGQNVANANHLNYELFSQQFQVKYADWFL
jgi:hypothetical protein